MLDGVNREAEIIAEIERLELDLRLARKRIEHARTEADKRVLNQQMSEMIAQIDHLRRALRPNAVR